MTIALAGLVVAVFYYPGSREETVVYTPNDVLRGELIDYHPDASTLSDALGSLTHTILEECDRLSLPISPQQKTSLAQAYSHRVRALVAFDELRDAEVFVAQGDTAALHLVDDSHVVSQYDWFRNAPFSTSHAIIRFMDSNQPNMPRVELNEFGRMTSTAADGRLRRTGSGQYVEVVVPMMCRTVKGPSSEVVQLVGFSFKWSPQEEKWLIFESVKYGDPQIEEVVPAVPITFY